MFEWQSTAQEDVLVRWRLFTHRSTARMNSQGGVPYAATAWDGNNAPHGTPIDRTVKLTVPRFFGFLFLPRCRGDLPQLEHIGQGRHKERVGML